jgi:hypothetical protein
MLEKGIDPEQAGFGSGFGGGEGGFGGFGGGAGGFSGFGGAGGFPGGFSGGFPGGGRGGTFSGGGSFGNADAFKIFESMFGGGGGGGGASFGNMFGGGDGGGQQKTRQRRQQQQQKQQQQKPKPKEVFEKNDPSGVAVLGRPKFPDSKAKNPWLILFYDKNQKDDKTTQEYIAQAKQLSAGVLKKAKGDKNNMIYRIGAIDCSTEKSFCKKRLRDADFPRFAIVLNGDVQVVARTNSANAKKLHDYTTNTLKNMDGLVTNVNSARSIKERILSSSGTPGHPTVSIVLLTDKYETSPIYASLSYKHRHDGFTAFAESRGSNSELAKEYGVESYPTVLALIGSIPLVDQYAGSTFDLANLSKWVDGLGKKHFKNSSSSDSSNNKKKQKAR